MATEKVFKISLAVKTQYQRVTDGQTDGQTPHDSKDRAMQNVGRVKTLTHINAAVARQDFVCIAPDVMITVGECEKVSWVHVGKTKDNFIGENQIMPQASYN